MKRRVVGEVVKQECRGQITRGLWAMVKGQNFILREMWTNAQKPSFEWEGLSFFLVHYLYV